MPIAPDLSGCALDGRYELHAVIGEGAFGRVYRGRDRRLERSVAIKMIKPWWAEDPEWVDSFEREARLLARVSDPGIVQIFDVGKAPEGLYYVSELVLGESLAVRLRRGPVSPWEAAAIAEQLCRALGHAHHQSVVHRDVKPANILITPEGRVKVGDFGVARLAEGSNDGASATIVGTPRYMAPEQARGRAITPATDVYSVGVVVYEMLAGRPPFTERTAVELALRHLNDIPDPLPEAVPLELQSVVGRALAKKPAERYRDGREMADALARAQLSAPVTPRRTAPAPGHFGRTRPRPATRPPARLLTGGASTPPRPPQLPPPVPAFTPRGSGSPPGVPSSSPPAPQPRQLRARPASAAPPGHRAPGAGPPRPQPDATRRGKLSPRRNVNPSGRRRSAAALALAFLLLGTMLAIAAMLGAEARVTVPRLTGLTRAAVRSRARRLSLEPAFRRRFDRRVAKGRVIGQAPAPGRRIAQGSRIIVTLSAGPAPVRVPPVAGEPAGGARRALQRVGLRARTKTVVAPGVSGGTVTSQDPGPGIRVPRGSRVTLSVAEVPRWQPLRSIRGGGRTQTIRFHVRGPRWRVVYTMGFQGTCTWIIFCSGPNATVTNARTGARRGFGLADGGRRSQVFGAGSGDYRLTVSPGSDGAAWSLWIEDYY